MLPTKEGSAKLDRSFMVVGVVLYETVLVFIVALKIFSECRKTTCLSNSGLSQYWDFILVLWCAISLTVAHFLGRVLVGAITASDTLCVESKSKIRVCVRTRAYPHLLVLRSFVPLFLSRIVRSHYGSS